MLRLFLELLHAKLSRKSTKEEGDGPRATAPVATSLDLC